MIFSKGLGVRFTKEIMTKYIIANFHKLTNFLPQIQVIPVIKRGFNKYFYDFFAKQRKTRLVVNVIF